MKNRLYHIILRYLSLSMIIAVALFGTAEATAVPARPIRVQLTLTDGRQLWATLTGDEFAHWYVGEDGLRYTIGDDGRATPLSDAATTTLLSRRRAQLEQSGRLPIDQLGLTSSPSNQESAQGIAPSVRSKAPMKASSLTTGSKKGLVILVNFADKGMSAGGTNVEFTNMFNQKGYSKNNHIGSVHDYFYDNSYGKFDITFDVIGPVTVSQPMSYYGNNNGGSDQYAATMIAEACKLADKSVNFRNYDWDGDGNVEQVYVIYAGYAESSGGAASTIWPHQYYLSAAKYFGDGPGALHLDGVTIDRYACSSELTGASGTTLAGIGTACHEFSHCLGLRDAYDVDYSGAFGMGHWSLMDSGSYNGRGQNGERPVGYTAFERFMIGWADAMQLDEPCQISNMAAISDKPEMYLIAKTNQEYYILENRQNGKWDYLTSSKSFGHGLLITHIDLDASRWNSNRVNDDPSHQCFTFFSAANTIDHNYSDDTYPGTSGNNMLTDTSHPAAVTFAGNRRMEQPITDITETGGKISFTFCGGSGDGPGHALIESITLPSTAHVFVGTSTEITATVKPSNASKEDIVWSTSDPSTAYVSGGYVHGVSAGTVYVYCESPEGVRSNNCLVTVEAALPEEITLIPSYVYLPIGQSRDIETRLTPWYAVTDITWQNLSPAVIDITPSGKLTALAAGSGSIEVRTSNGKTAYCEVTVPPNLSRIVLPEVTMVAAGRSLPVQMKVSPEDCWYEHLSWVSSDTKIARVSPDGNIYANSEGETTVTVTASGGVTASTRVQVYRPTYYFIVLFRHDDTMRFEIHEEPKITYEGADIVVTTANLQNRFPASTIRKMMMVDHGIIESLGDLNKDGQTTIADVSYLIQTLMDSKNTDLDINFDGILDNRDLQELIHIILSETKDHEP